MRMVATCCVAAAAVSGAGEAATALAEPTPSSNHHHHEHRHPDAGKWIYTVEKCKQAARHHQKELDATTVPLDSTRCEVESEPTAVPALRVKVVVLGESGVGKTWLVHRHKWGHELLPLNATIGASFVSVDVRTRQRVPVQAQIWDTAGQERYRCMVPMYVRNAGAAIIVYDISNRKSFRAVEGWANELRRCVGDAQPPVVLVGNKCDLAEHRRAVSYQEGREMAERLGDARFFETSAYDAKPLDELLTDLATDAYEQSLEEQRRQTDALSEMGERQTSASSSDGLDDKLDLLAASRTPGARRDCCSIL